MRTKTVLSSLVLAAVTATTLSTASWAAGECQDMGPRAMMNFDAMDADADGKITDEEVAAFRKSRVTGLDANGDGKLSAEELVAQKMQHMQARAEADVARMIAARDVDGDGLLSVEEMAAPQMPARMLSHLDADKDGAVSKQEYEAAQAEMGNHRGGAHMMGNHGSGDGAPGEDGCRAGRGHDHDHGGQGWFRRMMPGN